MSDIRRKISYVIETQFPDVYREYGVELVEFIKSYYEYLESQNKYSANRTMLNDIDIDETNPAFLTLFHQKLLASFPYAHSTDKRFLIKHIIDFYSSKGSPYSLELLMKLLFNEDAKIYYPGNDVLRISDSDWYKPEYLEVTKSNRTQSYLNKEITGARSGAKAFVESIVRKRVKGKVFDVLYLSSVRGSFRSGERITDDGIISKAPIVKGSLTQVNINLGGRDNKVGDIFNVVTTEGVKGKVKVTEVINATGRVDFEIIKPGWGYTTDGTTNVYVSDAILFIDNANQDFIEFEEVYQPVQKVYTTSSADITSLTGLIGQEIKGYDIGFSTVLGTGTIVSVANTVVANGEIVVTANASANALITVMPTSGTFIDQKNLTLNSNNILYVTDEIIAEESIVDLNVTNLTGTFTVGEKVNQRTYETYGTVVTGITGTLDTANVIVTVSSTSGLIPGQPLTKTGGTGAFRSGTTIRRVISSTQLVISRYPLTSGSITFTAGTFEVLTNYAFGLYDSIANNVIRLTEAWGTFNEDVLIVGANSGASALPTTVTIENSNIGARGKLTSYTPGSNTIVVEMIYGAFDVGNKIRGEKTGKIYTVNSSADGGAVIVALSTNANANGVITNSTSNNVTGIIIGQNTSSIGISGNTSSFYYSNTYTSYVKTDRKKLLSPPRYANNTIIDLTKEITRIPGGRDATFEIGVIGNIDPDVTLYTDIIGGNNIAGVPYSTIRLDGQGSGFGYVQDVTITAGGTGYTNNTTIAFEGGGFAGGEPSITASAFITTDGSGTITDITVDIPGSGYFEAPTIVLPDNGAGTDATVAVVMNYGYGFPKAPHAEYYNFIGDVLNMTISDIGSIEILARINPGTQYTADPYVKVYNPYVVSYQRSDLILNVANGSNGSFSVGEELVQIIDNEIFSKGVIKATEIVAGVGKIYLERRSIGISFTEGVQIAGRTTGARADLISVYTDSESRFIGDNAIITGTAISANGVATKVEVVDSGYGYITGDEVVLESVTGTNPYIITANTSSTTQGISEGYWRTTNSHLNSEKKIHDNKYYQEYSYDVISGLSLNRYENILNRVGHVSGTRMFGSVEKSAEIAVGVSIDSSSIEEI